VAIAARYKVTGIRSRSSGTRNVEELMPARGVVVTYETIRCWRKLLKGLRYVPRVIVTDRLASYQVAHRELVPSVTHRRSKYLNIEPRTLISRPGSGNG
jgi:transposase-like protein